MHVTFCERIPKIGFFMLRELLMIFSKYAEFMLNSTYFEKIINVYLAMKNPILRLFS